MDKDKNRKQALPPLPPSDGLRRSRRNLPPPPPPPPPCEEGSYSASERKRPRQQEGEEDPREEVSSGESVNISVHVSSKASLGSGGDGSDGSEDGSAVKGKAQLKVRGAMSDLGEGEASVTPAGPGVTTRSAAARRLTEVSRSLEDPAEEGEAHPCLFIENVLDVIFKHLINQPGPRTVIANDVQNIRLVCKTWKTSITRLYRQTRPETEFNRYARHQSNRFWGRKSLTEFMRTMKSSQMLPVQKYSFHVGVFQHDNPKMFREFLFLCGPETVKMSMTFLSGDAERVMSNLEKLADFQMMKLKTLKLCIQGGGHKQDKLEADQVHGNAKLVELLLVAAKSLSKLDLTYQSYATPSYRIQQGIIIQQLSEAIVSGLPRTVKHLKLSLDMPESGFNTLADIQSKLQKLKLNVCFELGGRTLYRFLQSQAATLRHLEIYSEDADEEEGDGIVVEFPRLDELVHLDLYKLTVGTTAHSNFAETFPKLQCLEIPYMELESNFVTLLSTVKKPSRSLKVLHLPTWNCTATTPLVRDVAKAFSCLTELYIRLLDVTKDMMGEVFTYFDNLEVLHISLDVSLDFCYRMKNTNSSWMESIFSGISESDCFRIQTLQNFDNEDLRQLPRQPSILNLTRLRKLVIDSPCLSCFTFTDFSAHFIFLGMDNLREIQLPTFAVKFGPMYSELLRDKLVAHE